MLARLRNALPAVLVALLPFAPGCAAELDAEDGDEEIGISDEALTAAQSESQIVAEISRRRVARGLSRLADGACVDGFAERWATHLVGTGGLTHQSLGPMTNKCNASWAGETLASSPTARSASEWVDLWMNSPAHKAIVMKPRADRAGIALRQRPNGSYVLVGDFIDRPGE